jgi:hypothetical protein
MQAGRQAGSRQAAGGGQAALQAGTRQAVSRQAANSLNFTYSNLKKSTKAATKLYRRKRTAVRELYNS